MSRHTDDPAPQVGAIDRAEPRSNAPGSPPRSNAPTRPTLRLRYELRQTAVLRASAGVFADRGYDSTSIQELSAQIGLATGGIYHYFGSKERLLIAICDELVEPLLADARALVALEQAPAQRLRLLVRLWVNHVVAHRDHMLVFQQERHAIEHGEQWAQVRRSRKAFERLVEKAVGDAAPHLDRRVALSALLGMVNHTAQWYDGEGRLRPDELADGYIDLILGAVPD